MTAVNTFWCRSSHNLFLITLKMLKRDKMPPLLLFLSGRFSNFGGYSKDFLQSSLHHFTFFLWLSYNLLTIIFWLSYNSQIILSDNLKSYFNQLKKILWSSFHQIMIILRSYCDHLRNILWYSKEHIMITLCSS